MSIPNKDISVEPEFADENPNVAWIVPGPYRRIVTASFYIGKEGVFIGKVYYNAIFTLQMQMQRWSAYSRSALFSNNTLWSRDNV